MVTHSILCGRFIAPVLIAFAMVIGCQPRETASAEFALTREGKPVVTIVIAAAPTPAAVFGADELQLHVQKITGVTLPIANDTEQISGARILVGPSAATSRLGLQENEFEDQEYLIRFLDRDLIVMGKEQATEYAVHDFLERFCDVRWYGPGDSQMVFPETDTLIVEPREVRRRPAFVWRTMFPWTQFTTARELYGQPSDEDLALFWRRLRAGGEAYACNHSLEGYYDRFWTQNPQRPEVFVTEHPDWFAQGYSASDLEAYGGQPPQLCYSNPGLVDQVVNDARRYFDGEGAANGAEAAGKFFAMVPMDRGGRGHWCKCPECQSQIDQQRLSENSFDSNGSASDYWFGFVNKVARELAKSHPDKYISTLAYAGYSYYPRQVEPETTQQGISMTRNVSRRQAMMGVVTAAGWAICGSGQRANAAELTAVVHETKTISQDAQHYHGWPTLVRRSNGKLILLYSGGREDHVCPFGRLELMRSSDDGKTWSPPTVVFETKIDDRESGLMETARGTLIANTFTSVDFLGLLAEAEQIAPGTPAAWAPERLRRWQAARDQLTEDPQQADPGMWMIRSTDGGQTWSKPDKSPVSSPHGPIQLADGRLLHAGKEVVGTGRTGVCESTDDGQTWQWLAEIPQRPGDNSQIEYHELHVVEAVEGRLVAHIRNHNANNFYETLQTESSDGGKSWTLPHTIGVWGLPSHLLRLRDGRLLMSYGYRRTPFGNQARVSNNQGRTWSKALTISDDGVGGDLGYPSTVQLADDSLLSVWYEGGSYQGLIAGPHAVLRQSHWTLIDK